MKLDINEARFNFMKTNKRLKFSQVKFVRLFDNYAQGIENG